MPVYPGDVVLGDGDGVMIIPLELLDVVIEEALYMEHFEPFAQNLILQGTVITDVYPANEETKAKYAEYRKANPPQFGE